MASTAKFADVPLRVKTWGYIIAVFLIALLHPITLLLFISFISFWGQYEVYKFAMPTIKYPWVLCAISTAIQVVLFSFNTSYFDSTLLLAAYFTCVFSAVLIQNKAYWKYCITIVLFVLSINVLWYIGTPFPGYKFLLLLIIPIELNDVFQYLSGKLFGKHKIVPNISPNKTVEGLMGGVVGYCIVFMSLFYVLGFSLPWYKVLCFGIVMSLLGFCGDVFFSYIKRSANVKDTGSLLPGHGGLLDRVDSLLFTAPLFYLVIL